MTIERPVMINQTSLLTIILRWLARKYLIIFPQYPKSESPSEDETHYAVVSTRTLINSTTTGIENPLLIVDLFDTRSSVWVI